jgi:hypothetical protein
MLSASRFAETFLPCPETITSYRQVAGQGLLVKAVPKLMYDKLLFVGCAVADLPSWRGGTPWPALVAMHDFSECCVIRKTGWPRTATPTIAPIPFVPGPAVTEPTSDAAAFETPHFLNSFANA